MDFLFNLLVFLHFVGLASLLGGWLVQMSSSTKDINNAKLVDTVIKAGVVIDRAKLDLPVNRPSGSQD